jgi:putative holliday junction resolvase
MTAEPQDGRVLGLDLGDARIGVAISDPDRRMALPFGTIHVGQPPGELRAIAAIVREQAISAVVLGLPLSLSGAAGPAARHAQGFAQTLEALLDVPVHLQDERLSTAEAERQLSASGLRGKDRRRVVDRTAAAVILQAWLDARPL